jgi:hypothetical protein
MYDEAHADSKRYLESTLRAIELSSFVIRSEIFSLRREQ